MAIRARIAVTFDCVQALDFIAGVDELVVVNEELTNRLIRLFRTCSVEDVLLMLNRHPDFVWAHDFQSRTVHCSNRSGQVCNNFRRFLLIPLGISTTSSWA